MSTPLVINETYNAPIEKVWRALTSIEEMKKWYFDVSAFTPELGCEFQFLGGTEAKKYLHLCKVIEVIPGRTIAYTWRYDTYPGMSTVTFELFPDGNTTRLTLTHEGIESFPQDDPNFARESFTAGWTYLAGTALKEYVEGGKS